MLKDLVLKNRSYRGFDEKWAVGREQLTGLIDLARLTASSVNIQPLKYYLIWEKGECDKLQPLTAWARRLKHLNLPREGHRPSAFIVICQDTDIAANTDRFLKDVGIVAQTILLGAVEQGLGGIMIGNFTPSAVAEAFKLPQNLIPMLILAIGKPDEAVVITEAKGGDVAYTRDENHVTYVPKRSLNEILIN